MSDKAFFSFLMKIALLCVSLPMGAPLAHAQWLTGEEAIMGTAIRVELWADDKAAGDTLGKDIPNWSLAQP